MTTLVRRVALAAAVASLVGIGVRPTWPARAPAVEAVLVTPGAPSGAIRRLTDSLGGAPVYADPVALRRAPTPVRRLHVAGWGLDADAWRALDSFPIVVHPAAPPQGIVRASWPPQLALGDRLTVEGVVAGAPATAWVFLSDPAGVADSALLRAGGAFQLHALPRAAGRHRYVLRVGSTDRPMAAESLGVVVTDPPAWRVLILERAPSFETRALRDWIAARRGVVAVRTSVSRGRTRTEFVNQARTPLEPLTARLLAQFDAVVTDGLTLAGMGETEQAELRRAVTDGGLGVLIVPDTAVYGEAEGFFLGFGLERIEGLDVRQIRPRWAGLARPITDPVPADPFTLRARFGLESLMEDGTGGVVAQVAPRGAGRVGLSLIAAPARWQRLGDHATFSAYWSRLLAAVAGGRVSAARWSIETPGPWLVHRPVTVAVQGRQAVSLALVTGPSGERDSVYLAPDPLDPTRWQGTYWPRVPGWHEIEGAAGVGVGGGGEFYAQAASAWRGRQATERLDATARRVVGRAGRDPDGPLATVPIRRAISPIWFFGLFLLAAGYLWSARRVASLDPARR